MMQTSTSILSATDRQSAINWLHQDSYPALPVAPAQPAEKYPAKDKSGNVKTDRGRNPLPAFTGKNPSYLDKQGKPHLINHTAYQNRLPTDREIKTWFENPSNGIGTLGGWNSTTWLDFDVKQFDSQKECDHAFYGILEAYPVLLDSWWEKTHSGGYRLAVKCKQQTDFTNFALEPGGKHRGEALGSGRFTVLAPTIGVSGNAYECMNRAVPVEIKSLESIGIYFTRTKVTAPAVLPDRHTPNSIPGAIPLESLGTDESREVLRGMDIKGDRSSSLTAAIREWYGWQNWAAVNGISVSGASEDLARHTGTALGLDSERVTQILKTIDHTECQPAALSKGGEEACWKKVYRLDKATFQAKCPAHIADRIRAEWSEKKLEEQRGLSPEAEPQELEWRCLDSHQCQIGAWSKESEFAKPQDVSDWKQRAKSNPVGVEIRVSSEDGQEVAWVKFFNPKADFDFSVSKILTASDGGGLMLLLKRVESGQVVEIEAYIKSTETGKVTDFVNALKRETGRNLCCTLELKELQALIQSRTSRYRKNGGRTYRLAEVNGQQEDGTWVLEDCQFKADGTPTTEHKSLWVFNHQLGETEKIPSPKIAQQNPEALKDLVSAFQGFFHAEISPLVVFTCGYAVATMQRQAVMRQERKFPQLALFGDAGGGKSVASEVAASLVGMHEFSMTQFSESLLYEMTKSLSGLPLILNDPLKPGKKLAESRDQLNGIMWRLYNGKPGKVRGNEQIPHTNVVVSTNVALGEDTQAVESRLLKL